MKPENFKLDSMAAITKAGEWFQANRWSRCINLSWGVEMWSGMYGSIIFFRIHSIDPTFKIKFSIVEEEPIEGYFTFHDAIEYEKKAIFNRRLELM